MNKACVFLRREFGAYWLSPIGYVVMIIFLALNAFFAMQYFMTGMQASQMVGSMFRMWSLLFSFFLPAITMRLWAEERMNGTLELLLTYPVRVLDLVLGKFLAAFLFVLVMLALTLTIPITVSNFIAPGGSLDWASVWASYVGSALLASACLAIGLFWSSITSNQIVAYLISLLTLFLLNITSVIQAEDFWRIIKELVSWIGMADHFRPFVRGVISSQSVIYFLAVTAFFLWLNAVVLIAKKRRG